MAGIPIISDILGPGDPPPAPDYAALAEQTAESEKEMWDAALQASRYDVTSPLGSLTWTEIPGESVFDEDAYNAALSAWEQSAIPTTKYNNFTGEWEEVAGTPAGTAPTKADYTTTAPSSWTQSINLTPEAQEIFDKTLDMQNMTADIGLTANQQIADIFANPFTLPDFEDYDKTFYDSFLDRLETDINRDWESTQASLIAGGHSIGDEGYMRELEARSRALNDARSQAYIGAQQESRADYAQLMEALLAQRNQPINEYSAWRTGSQVDMPQFQTQPFITPSQGADYLTAGDMGYQAALAPYNAEVASGNALTSGLFSLGAGYLMGAPAGSSVANFLYGAG